MPVNCRCSIGSQLGWITINFDGFYALRKCTINRIMTNSAGSKYYSTSLCKPVSSNDVDPCTEWMETTPDIALDEVFMITDVTKAKAEKWVKWANLNPREVRQLENPFTMEAVESDADETEDT